VKIINLKSENFKRLVAVDITPTGNMVEITGRNGQGKSSVLDSIWAALGGLDAAPQKPIRKGESESRITLTLGADKPELLVTRTFRLDKTSRLTVQNADGVRFPSPQAVLDNLLGAMSVDPLAFDRMTARQQYDTLRTLVPGIDFDEIDRQTKADYDERTRINRSAKEARAAAAQLVVDTVLANGEIIDEATLTARLEEAGKINANIELRKANRARMRSEATMAKDAANRYRTDVERLRQQADELEKCAAQSIETASRIAQKLEAAGELPEPIDTHALVAEIDIARKKNDIVRSQKVREKKRRALLDQATSAELEASALTKVMDMREEKKRGAVQKANLPVSGIAFGDNEIMLGGVPWMQASDAERLTASISIAMAMNPTLRIVRVRDGSLLDEDSMKVLSDMAEKNDVQVWIERVDSSGRVGIVLEDGEVKNDIPEL